MVNSLKLLGQPSNVPAAGVPSSRQRKYSISTGACPLGTPAPPGGPLMPCRAHHQAPMVLCNRNFTMYGSVNSCVTAGSVRPSIFSPLLLTSSFFLACQNWYTQPRLSSAVNVSVGRLASSFSNG